MASLSALLADDGCMALTIRLDVDDAERMMYTVTTEELIRQAAMHSLIPIYVSRSTKDTMNRSALTWRKIIFKKDDFPAPDYPIHVII